MPIINIPTIGIHKELEVRKSYFGGGGGLRKLKTFFSFILYFALSSCNVI